MKPAPKSLRPPTDRKPGGHQGHPRHTLTPVEKPDIHIVHLPERCSCGFAGPFEEEIDLPVEARQVLDLPPRHCVRPSIAVQPGGVPGAEKRSRRPFPQRQPFPLSVGSVKSPLSRK